MKKFWFLIAFLALSAQARATTGDALYKACVNTGTTFESGWCIGYLNGFIEAEKSSAIAANRPPHFCIPSNVTMIHVREATMKYMTTHPDKKLLDADAILGQAIPSAYSCG